NLCLPDRMDVFCEIYACDPRQITLELTEKSSIECGADVLDVLTRLRIKGFKLSIDDFGIGYSSVRRQRSLDRVA
ncbi:MAG: EAL domain-containing protein, partial [Gammaproteobacteria bacterium]|nr:EAL domain-containing protein [Gammaproteobacteria bacterium]